jgi:hypothetical protein
MEDGRSKCLKLWKLVSHSKGEFDASGIFPDPNLSNPSADFMMCVDDEVVEC